MSSTLRFLMSRNSQAYWRTASAVPCRMREAARVGPPAEQHSANDDEQQAPWPWSTTCCEARPPSSTPAAHVLLSVQGTQCHQATHLEPLLVCGRLRGRKHLHKALATKPHAAGAKAAGGAGAREAG